MYRFKFIRNEMGYTLTELLVVLVIIGLVTSLAPPLFSRMVPGFLVENNAKRLKSDILSMRREAMRQGQSVELYLGERDGRYEIKFSDDAPWRSRQLTAGLSSNIDRHLPVVKALPDGSIVLVNLKLVYRSETRTISAEPVTNRIRVLEE